MCDNNPCDSSGCYGACPTSTRCSRKPCKPDCYLPEKCLTGIRVKDFLNEIADDMIIFKNYYANLRPSPLSGSNDGKQGEGGKQSRQTGGKGKKGRRSTQVKNIFGDSNDIGGAEEGEGGSDGSGKRKDHGRNKKETEHDRIKNHVSNKLNSFFDDALKQGMLEPGSGKGKNKGKKRSAKYYKEKLGIEISCVHSCAPFCCENEKK